MGASMPSRRAHGELNVFQVERVPTLDKDSKEGKIQTQPGAAGAHGSLAGWAERLKPIRDVRNENGHHDLVIELQSVA